MRFQDGCAHESFGFPHRVHVTACNQRWLVDKELRAGMSFDDVYGPSDSLKVGPTKP